MSDREIMNSKSYTLGGKEVKSTIKRHTRTSPGIEPVEEQTLPNARKHQIISFIKSGIRIIGYGFIVTDPTVAIVILVISEAVGVIEELV